MVSKHKAKDLVYYFEILKYGEKLLFLEKSIIKKVCTIDSSFLKLDKLGVFEKTVSNFTGES